MKFFFIGVAFLIFGLSAQAESVNLSELSECNDFYCPPGAGTPGSGLNDMREAIEVDTEISPLRGRQFENRVISAEGGDRDVSGGEIPSAEREVRSDRLPVPQPAPRDPVTQEIQPSQQPTTAAEINDGPSNQPVSQVQNQNTGGGGFNGGRQASGSGGFSSFGGSPSSSFSGGSGSNVNLPKLNVGSNTANIDGFIYKDEEVKVEKIAPIEAVPGTPSRLATVRQPQQQKDGSTNRPVGGNPSSRPTQPAAFQGGALGQGSSMASGGKSSKNKSPSTSRPRGQGGLFSKIANSLGMGSFFGSGRKSTSGSKRVAGSRGQASGSSQKSKSRRASQRGNGAPEFNRGAMSAGVSRIPASYAEYDSRQTFLYGKLCGVYADFASQNGLPTNAQISCPRQ